MRNGDAGRARPATADWTAALGHPYRLTILRYFLAAGTATPSEIAEAHGLPLGTTSYHVRFLGKRGIVRLAGRTQRRGASVHHYQLADRARVVSVLWGVRAELLVTDIERDHGRGDATVTLDAAGLAELRAVTADYLSRLGELGLQTRERPPRRDESERTGHGDQLTRVAVLLATDPGSGRTAP